MRMKSRSSISASCALAATILAIVTAVSAEWIEILFRIEPDGGSGALEWLIVAAFALLALVSTGATVYHRRIEQSRTADQRAG